MVHQAGQCAFHRELIKQHPILQKCKFRYFQLSSVLLLCCSKKVTRRPYEHYLAPKGMSASSSSASSSAGEVIRLPPHVSRVLFVKHLPFKITAKEMYDVFGKYGAIRQIRLGDPANKKTRGTAFVVYQDIIDAKSAVDHLSGFAVGGRYLLVMYY